MQDPRFVDVDGIRTRYFEAGSGPPMVFVHGGSIGSSYNAYHWSLNFDELAKRFHVYALDKLGNGHTDNPAADADYTMAAVIAHVHGFLRTMQIENAVLVGHSRGALPVTRIAIDDPARCSALVILDTNTLAPEDPSTPSDFYRKLEVAPVESNEEYASREPIANSYSTAHMTDDFVQAAADVVALEKTWTALAKMKTLGGSTFQPDVRVQRADTLDMIEAGRLDVPMLIAWGLDDPSAPIKLGMDLLGIVGPALPHVRLYVFNRAGHYAFREHAAEMNRLIAAFVDEVEAG